MNVFGNINLRPVADDIAKASEILNTNKLFWLD